jgi:S1-C subfamily serine protease
LLYRILKKLGLSFALIALASMIVHAQATTPSPPTPPPTATTPKLPAPPLDTLRVETSTRQTPQVVTIVHRLSGIKALALLRRTGETVAKVDDDVLTTPYVVTAITAGFVLGDGQNVVARLPQAEAEVESLWFTPKSSGFNSATTEQILSAPVASGATTAASATASSPRALVSPETSSLVVVQANGKQFAARYIGLDGGSGLSLLRIPGLKAPLTQDANEEQLAVGQLIRIFAPDRTAHVSNAPVQSTISLRIGEIEGKIKEITRTSTDKIARLTINAPNLSSALVGGIALNEAGEAVGIVETSNAGTARLIPIAAVRRAAERLLARQTSIPRPWLGVRGEAVKTTPLQTFFSSGWTVPEVAALKSRLEGILLTSVAPGTPAALANLRAGDVIVRVNDSEVRNAEDFSFALNEAGSGATAKFTVFRGQNPKPIVGLSPVTSPLTATAPYPAIAPETFNFKPFDINIKLGESLNPAVAMKLAEEYSYKFPTLNSLPTVARGIETAPLSQRAAAHLGARSGMLVLYVDLESLAAQAGLHAFDVIETIEGKLVGRSPLSLALPKGNPQRLTLGIVRDQQKLEITIQQKDKPQP